MTDRDGVLAPITCDCGHHFNEPIAGTKLEDHTFSCSACGKNDRFSQDQIAKMIAEYKVNAVEASDLVKKTAEELCRTFKGK